MAKVAGGERRRSTRKPLVWFHGQVKSPPFTAEGRQEAGMLLRVLQEGEQFGTRAITGGSCFLLIPTQSWSWRFIPKRQRRYRTK